MNQTETNRREKLRKEKPLAYKKLMTMVNTGNISPIIQFQKSYLCNFHCDHCSVHTIQQLAIKQKRQEMTIKDIKELSRQADEFGIFRWEINGGEPLINKDLDQVIEAIDSSKYYMNLVTNAWLVDEKMAKHLKDLGIDRIQIGFDSLIEKEHDSFRNKDGAHYRAMKAVDNCQNAELDVFVTTVVTKQRLYSKEFIDFIEYFNNKDVGVFMTFAKPVGEWANRFDLMINEDDLPYVSKLQQKYNLFSHISPKYDTEGGCLAFKGLIAITPYGDVLPCQYIFISLGNIFLEPLKDILERGSKLNVFKTNICPLAMSKNFVDKYIVPTYNANLPVYYTKIFKKDDFKE